MNREVEEKDLNKISSLLKTILGRTNYVDINRMGGLTNRTYKVIFPENECYVVRIPGEGTEELIERNNEKVSTELACKLGIDAEMLYFGTDGSKVTKYIPNAITMSAEAMREEQYIERAAEILRKLHDCGEDTGVAFEVFDMAEGYEQIIDDNKVRMYDDYMQTKATVFEIKSVLDKQGEVRRVPCHNDALCENWVMSGEEKMYLIDWEYAGMNDGIWDLAEVSIEAKYNHSQDEILMEAYLGNKPTKQDWKHFLANKLYVDYLWTLWAKARVPYDGQMMEEWAAERYERLKKNIQIFRKI